MPAPHDAQVTEPVPEAKVPGAQAVQSSWPLRNRPMGQGTQMLSARPLVRKPFAQLEQPVLVWVEHQAVVQHLLTHTRAHPTPQEQGGVVHKRNKQVKHAHRAARTTSRLAKGCECECECK